MEPQNNGLSSEQIIERLGNPKEMAKAYLGEFIAKSNSFSWKKMSAIIAFYSFAGLAGMIVLPITSICGIAFMICSIICPIAGIIKFVAHLMGYEIEEIGISIGFIYCQCNYSLAFFYSAGHCDVYYRYVALETYDCNYKVNEQCQQKK